MTYTDPKSVFPYTVIRKGMAVNEKIFDCHKHPKKTILRLFKNVLYVANCNTPACNELHSFPVILIKYANAT